VDSFLHRVVGFDVAADFLEKVDLEVVAPRIVYEKGNFIPRYALPKGNVLLPTKNPELTDFFHKGLLKRIFDLGGFNGYSRIEETETSQRIVLSRGEILVSGGIVEARGFSGYDVCNITWPISKLISSCDFGKTF
jgi:hypothetical protein